MIVPAQDVVPLAVGTGEVFLNIGKAGFKPGKIFFLTGIPVGHGSRNEHFCLGPPALDVKIGGFPGLVLTVQKEDDAAELLVPAAVNGIEKDSLGFFVEEGIALGIGPLHHKPAAFAVVAGVHNAALGNLFEILAVDA